MYSKEWKKYWNLHLLVQGLFLCKVMGEREPWNMEDKYQSLCPVNGGISAGVTFQAENMWFYYAQF